MFEVYTAQKTTTLVTGSFINDRKQSVIILSFRKGKNNSSFFKDKVLYIHVGDPWKVMEMIPNNKSSIIISNPV